MYDIGPFYVAVIIAATVVAVTSGHIVLFESGIIHELKIPSAVLGVLLVIFGEYLWHGAVFRAKVDDGIVNNKLVTTGVYAFVRNPIYSALMLFCTGALLISGNLFFYPLFFFYWVFMTVLMKCTEEKWLKNLYGREYEEYCRRVNRCIPWLPKSGKAKYEVFGSAVAHFHIRIREEYSHCMYPALRYEEYGRLLERNMKSKVKE